MGKIIAYERLNTEVVEIDTVAGSIANLGGALPSGGVIDTAPTFDARSQSIVANFRGDVYCVTRAVANFLEVFKLVGGAWVLVHTIFPAGGS